MARVNHKKVKQLIQERRGKISDREFFTSRLLALHFEDIAAAQTKRYGSRRPVRVHLTWEPNASHAACTNNLAIHINVGNPIITQFPTREERYQMVCGLFAHELGHCPVHGLSRQPDLWAGDLRLPVVPGAACAPHGQRPGKRAGPVGLRPGGAGEPAAACAGGPRGGGTSWRTPLSRTISWRRSPAPWARAWTSCGNGSGKICPPSPSSKSGRPRPAGVLQPIAALFVLWQVRRAEGKRRPAGHGAPVGAHCRPLVREKDWQPGRG